MKNNNFYTVTGWMINDLKLSGNELICYAIIYGFSQDGESMFMGSLKYLSEWMNVTKGTVVNSLKGLLEKGYIKKVEETKNNIHYCYYQDAVNSGDGGISNFDIGISKSLMGNNIYNNINKEKKDNNKLLSKKSSDKEPSLFIEEPTEEDKFNAWFKLKYPVLSENQRPLTLKGMHELETEFTDEEIFHKLDVMEARKRFNRDYSDVQRTCANWLRMDKDPKYRERFRNKKKEEPKPVQQ